MKVKKIRFPKRIITTAISAGYAVLFLVIDFIDFSRVPVTLRMHNACFGSYNKNSFL